MTIALVHTGGTIGMSESVAGRVPDPAFVERLRVDGLLDGIDATVLDPLLDSANVGPVQWQRIADAVVAAVSSGADAVVVLHGTDTLAYTAAALTLALPLMIAPLPDDGPVCVVLTGAQHPLYHPDGTRDVHAEANLADAVSAAKALASVRMYDAADSLAPGTVPQQSHPARPRVRTLVQFGDELLPGLHATKSSSVSAQGFTAPNGRSDAGETCVASELQTPSSQFHGFAPHEIGVATVFPGLTADQLRASLGNGPAALLRCFGSGTVPAETPGIEQVLQDAHARGQVVVAVSQSAEGGVHLGAYAAAAPLQSAAVIDGRDLTVEAALAAVHVGLGCGFEGDALGAYVAQVARG